MWRGTKYRLSTDYFSAHLKTNQVQGVWEYISNCAHAFSVIDWLGTERRVSLSARVFQFYLNIFHTLGDNFQVR